MAGTAQEMLDKLNALDAPQQSGPSALLQQLDAVEQGIPQGAILVGKFADNGRVYREANGQLGAVSDGMSSTDSETVARIMKGDSYADVFKDRLQNERIAQNPVASRANEIVRGTPFIGSYIDEAVGLVSPQARDNMRASTEAMQAQRPKETMALNAGGAVLGSIPAVIAAGPSLVSAAGNTVGARALQAAGLGLGLGGAEGAIYGAGEGTTSNERMSNLGRGAATGAAAGAVLGAAAPYAAKAAQPLVGWFRGKNPDINTIGQTLGISKPAALVVRNALNQGDEAAAMAALQRGGDGAMLADASQATRSLLDTAAASPGVAGDTARRAITERTTGAANDLTSSLDDTLGGPRGINEITSEIRTQSAGARSATYEAAYAQPINYASPDGQLIESLLPRVPEGAIKRANALMKIRGEESAQIMAKIADDGSVVFEQMPDVRQLDYITRALRDVAAESDGAGRLGGQTAMGQSLESLATQIRSSTRKAVPEYGAALDTAADAIGQRNAVESGYDLLRSGTKREDIAQAIHGTSVAERDAMKQGVRSYIDDITANVTRTITDGDTTAREGIKMLREMSSRANQTKLRMLLGNDAAEKLLSQVDETATAFELRAAVAENSKTAVRQGTQQMVSDVTQGGVLSSMMRGEPVNASKRIIQAITGETDEAIAVRQMGLYQEIADALVNTRGARAQQALHLINRAIQGHTVSKAQAQIIATVVTSDLASGTAQTVGREASQPRATPARAQ